MGVKMNNQRLSDKLSIILEHEGDIEIPNFIRDNLSKELREYQEQGLRYFYCKERNHAPITLCLIWQQVAGRH